jgi:hypothetical protein
LEKLKENIEEKPPYLQMTSQLVEYRSIKVPKHFNTVQESAHEFVRVSTTPKLIIVVQCSVRM